MCTNLALPPARPSAAQVAVIHSILAALWFCGLWWLMRAYSRTLIRLFARCMFLDIHIRN